MLELRELISEKEHTVFVCFGFCKERLVLLITIQSLSMSWACNILLLGPNVPSMSYKLKTNNIDIDIEDKFTSLLVSKSAHKTTHRNSTGVLK